MRLFYALFPPAHVQQQLARAQEALGSYKGWKAVKPEQLHLTLLFLGEVEEGRLKELKEAGSEVSRRHAPFKVLIQGTGYFPANGSPRIWFAKAEASQLLPLAEDLRQALPQFAVDQDFKPHITLARKKNPAPRTGPVVFDCEFAAQEFSLVQSELLPSGSEYQLLEKFSLAGPWGGTAVPHKERSYAG